MMRTSIRSVPVQEFPLWKRALEHRRPLSFDLELTSRCNHNCSHCYNNLPEADAEARRTELSVEEIRDIASQAASMGVLWCLVTGGEPLVREDFPEIYLILKNMGFLVSVFTNATLLTPELVDLFKAYPPRDIETTVYGVSRATYERVTRIPGSFEAFRRGIDSMLEHRLPVRLKAMALRANQHELPAIGAFCRERTKDFYRFDPFLHLRYDHDPGRNREIQRQRLSIDDIVALEQSDPARMQAVQRECARVSSIPKQAAKSAGLFQCSIASGSFAIGSDGYLRPCSALRHPDCAYDLRTGNLREAWHVFLPKLLEMRTERASFLETCNNCTLFNLCLWCPAHAYLETGELDGMVPYYCELAHARAKAFSRTGGNAALPGP